eukprot:TRINITY_DN18446_c0_g2_i3.p1 TRINITY_DN18446_c0_g2~~TRINITY_DN18446_c0_g2_i3.p1  ORF type:complete len:115 (+),score=1.08 TRINITY_DN18446_c0_g2_i3:186-530(+)
MCSAGSHVYHALKEMLQNGKPGETFLYETHDLRGILTDGDATKSTTSQYGMICLTRYKWKWDRVGGHIGMQLPSSEHRFASKFGRGVPHSRNYRPQSFTPVCRGTLGKFYVELL